MTVRKISSEKKNVEMFTWKMENIYSLVVVTVGNVDEKHDGLTKIITEVS